jgi:hypothetical protein
VDFASLALQVAPVSYYSMLCIGMSTCNVFCHHMCPKLFCLFLSILIDFFIPCVIRLILSCPPVMCSFIRYALYCILQLHSDRFLNPMCLTLYDIMFTRMCSFIQGVLFFIFFLFIRNAFSIPMYICFTLSGQPVMCSFVLCVSCFALSCPLALLFHPICYMFYIVISTQVVSF